MLPLNFRILLVNNTVLDLYYVSGEGAVKDKKMTRVRATTRLGIPSFDS